MNNLFDFLIMFVFGFGLTYSYMIFMNGILDADVRKSVQIYVSAVVMVIITIVYITLIPRFEIAFNIAIYARTVSFVFAYMLARKVVSWLDW